MTSSRHHRRTAIEFTLAGVGLPECDGGIGLVKLCTERRLDVIPVTLEEALTGVAEGRHVGILLGQVNSDAERAALRERFRDGWQGTLGLVLRDSSSTLGREVFELGADGVVDVSDDARAIEIFVEQIAALIAERTASVSLLKTADLIEILPDSVAVADSDANYRLVGVGRSALVSMPVSAEDEAAPARPLVGNVDTAVDAGDAEAIRRTIRRSLVTGEPQNLVYLRRLGGERVWMHGYCAPLGGDDSCVLWVARDVTTERDLLNEVEAARLQKQAAIDCLPLGVYWKDTALRFKGMNRLAREVFGEPDEQKGANSRASEDVIADLERGVLETGTPVLNSVQWWGALGPNGGWAELNITLRTSEDGRVLGILGAFEDVSERERMIEELKRTRGILSATQALAKLGSFSLDLTTMETTVSDEYLSLHGLPPGSPGPRPDEFSEYIHDPRDAARLIRALGDLAGQGTPVNLEFWLTARDGVRRRVRMLARVVAEGLAAGMIQDVTSDRQRELDHHLAGSLLQPKAEVPTAGEWAWDPSTGGFTWDANIRSLLGLPMNAPSTRATMARLLMREHARTLNDGLVDCVTSGVPFTVEVMTRPRGQARSVALRVVGMPVRAPNGAIVSVVGVVQDRTHEQLAVEAGLREERMLRNTAGVSNVGGWYLDVAAGILEPTAQLRELLAMGERDLLTIDEVFGMIHEDDTDIVGEALARCIEEGVPYVIEVRAHRFDGRLIWCRVSGEPSNVGGETVGIYGSFMDISEERERLKAVDWQKILHENSEYVSGIGGWRYDVRLDEVHLTRSMRHLMGTPSPEPISWSEAMDDAFPEAGAFIEEELRRCIETATPFQAEVRHVRPSGEVVWLASSGEPITRGGRVVAVVGVSREITQELSQRREREGFEARVQQAQKLESLGVLAGGIAHDFNNLLVSVMGYASIAISLCDPDGMVVEMLQNVSDAAQNAADLTKQLLAYSGKGRFVVEPVQVATLVNEMSSIVRVALPKGVTLVQHMDEALPPVLADRAQLAQVVMNLITNAGEACQIGGVVTITTSLWTVDAERSEPVEWSEPLQPGPYVCLEVSDDGAGMDQITLARIFEPFFSTKFTGRGLGLAAVMGIVRGHRGAIGVDSELGRGTVVKVLLPADVSAIVSKARTRTSLASLHGRALVVDDEASIRKISRRILERAGMVVELASDGQEAVEKFSASPDDFDLVLLDLTMPRLNGLETFRAVRQVRPDVHVVLMSGYSQEGAIADIGGCRLSGFIQKPFRPDELVELVRDVLGAG